MGHLKTIDFPFRTKGKLTDLGVPTLKHFSVSLSVHEYNHYHLALVTLTFSRSASRRNMLAGDHV